MDCYDIAVRAEWLGVGLWASRNSAPDWTAEEVGAAFLRATGDGEEVVNMRRKAKEYQRLLGSKPGRDIAAQTIVDYMHGKEVGVAESGSQEIGHEREL